MKIKIKNIKFSEFTIEITRLSIYNEFNYFHQWRN